MTVCIELANTIAKKHCHVVCSTGLELALVPPGLTGHAAWTVGPQRLAVGLRAGCYQ